MYFNEILQPVISLEANTIAISSSTHGLTEKLSKVPRPCHSCEWFACHFYCDAEVNAFT